MMEFITGTNEDTASKLFAVTHTRLESSVSIGFQPNRVTMQSHAYTTTYTVTRVKYSLGTLHIHLKF